MNMTFAGKPIPYIHHVEEFRQAARDSARSAGFQLNQIITDVKRGWNAETRVMKPAEANTLIDELELIKYSEDVFTCDILTSAVLAIIEPESLRIEYSGFGYREIVEVGQPSWEPYGRVLHFTVLEV